MAHDNVAGQSSTRGAPVVASLQSESHTLDDTGTAANVPGPTRTELGAGAIDGVVQGEEGEDEAGSQPMEPYVGMRFDSLQIAKDHYNSYALQMGFSVKMNTCRRTPHTNVLVKRQFCCNKFKKPKADDGGAEAPPVMDPIPDPKPIDSDEEMEDEPPIFAEEEAGTSKKKKKRKRETIKQTRCKAKMLVKLIDWRWQVTHFVRDHNHPLVNKPLLSKYLRSQQGISPDEKEFLRILYNCNLTTGRMMHVVAEFYGSEMIVPFGPKSITNLCTSFRRDDTKEGDMIETIAHFKDMQKTDPDFYYKVKYDEEDRVVNIFWVDGSARKTYAEAYHDCISFDTTYMTNMYNMPFAPFIGIN
nr:protein FAR1-RELATED SEQUENCE 5-like [Aegilops tauschii subsp. strangulata]